MFLDGFCPLGLFVRATQFGPSTSATDSIRSMLFQKAKLTLPAIVFLVLLRLAIGWHFFQEGAVKVREDKFSSTPFLAAAKGPFAKQFHAMIPDYDGSIRIDAEKMSDACKAYGEKIKSEFNLNEDQSKEVDEILAELKRKRKETYDEWKSQIDEYKKGAERLVELDKDRSRNGVESLRRQRDEIETKWRGLGRPVLLEIDKSVEEMEERLAIEALSVDELRARLQDHAAGRPAAGLHGARVRRGDETVEIGRAHV